MTAPANCENCIVSNTRRKQFLLILFLNIFKTLVAYEVQQESASNFLLSSRHKNTDNNNKLNNVHSRKRRGNSGFFEETRDDDLERECHGERCSQEELAEIFPGKHTKQVAEWKRLTQQCYVQRCNAQGTKTCIQKWNSRECKCYPGWAGKDCGQDVDECGMVDEKACGGPYEVCKNVPGSYRCECVRGFQKVVVSSGGENEIISTKCEDIDECLRNPSPCGKNSECVNLQGGYDCQCINGYVQKEGSKDCVDVNECENAGTNDCSNEQKCENTEGGYSCICNMPGYYDSYGECRDIDECEYQKCGAHGTCENTSGSFACLCDEGYELNNHLAAHVCVDVDECKFFDSCADDQQCHNLDGSYICCESKYQVFSDGKCIDMCPPCGDHQFCEFSECFCESNWLPTPVDGVCQDLDECEDSENNRCTIADANSVCENSIGGFTCSCSYGWVNEEDTGVCIPADYDGIDYDGPEDINGALKPTDKLTLEPTSEYPTEATPEPTTVEPEIPSMLECSSGFEITNFYGTMMCSDIDECQTDNGGCYGMCMNYYGTRVCYEYFDYETRFCHHYHVKDTDNGNNYLGYKCHCFDNYHVCADTFSCFPNKGYREFDAYGAFRYDQEIPVELSHLGCPVSAIQFRDKCYFKVDQKMSYDEAVGYCGSVFNAELASVSDKKTWWVLGKQMDMGYLEFWLSQASDSNSTNIEVIGKNNHDSRLVANIMKNMDQLPPQWNYVPFYKEYGFFCEKDLSSFE